MSAAIPILLYHSVQPAPPPRFAPWAVSPARFAEHLDELARLQLVALDVAQLLALRAQRRHLPPNAVVITFDDGLADFAQHAWPALAARGLPATLYVTAGLLGASSQWLRGQGAGALPMLDAGALCELAADGVHIGAHSLTHPQLDLLGTDDARREIAGSKERLEQVLGAEVDSFAYPHGYHNRVVKQLVIEAGYGSAAAVRNALSHAQDDRFALARYTVMGNCSAAALGEVLAGRSVPRAAGARRLRAGAWRAVRKARATLGSGG